MVLNPDKCHYLTLGFKKPSPDFSFENAIIKKVTEEKIEGGGEGSIQMRTVAYN